MEPAPLPRDTAENCAPSRLQASLVIANYQAHATQTPADQALQEGAPVDFGFTERDRDTRDTPTAFRIHAYGQENGCIPDLLILAHFFIADIQNQINDLIQGTVAQASKFLSSLAAA